VPLTVLIRYCRPTAPAHAARPGFASRVFAKTPPMSPPRVTRAARTCAAPLAHAVAFAAKCYARYADQLPARTPQSSVNVCKSPRAMLFPKRGRTRQRAKRMISTNIHDRQHVTNTSVVRQSSSAVEVQDSVCGNDGDVRQRRAAAAPFCPRLTPACHQCRRAPHVADRSRHAGDGTRKGNSGQNNLSLAGR